LTATATAALGRARIAIGVIFLVHGAAVGSFATRIPWIRDRLGLGTGELGLALLVPAIGAIVAMPLAAALVHRFPAHVVTRVLVACWCCAMALPAFAPGFGWLCLALVVYGATAGMCDVAMNTQGVHVEEDLGRPIMSGLHGLWSVGGLLAAGVGVLAAHQHVDARVHLGLMAALLLLVGMLASRHLPVAAPVDPADAPPLFTRPTRAVLLIGLVGFCAIFAEAASADWCAVYLRDVMAGSDATAAGAYAGFAGTMAAGRLAGDVIVARLGPVAAVRFSGAMATAGALLVVVARTPALGIAGFSLIGLGVALVVPQAFAAGGRATPQAGHGIAGVATIAYGAGLAAPGAIGAVGDLTSLPVAFVVVAGLAALMIPGAGALRPRPATAETRIRV
jgi:MFS family permease